MFLLLSHTSSKQSVIEVDKFFHHKYQDRPIPNKTSRLRLMTKLRETNSVTNKKHKRSMTVLNEETVGKINEPINYLTHQII